MYIMYTIIIAIVCVCCVCVCVCAYVHSSLFEPDGAFNCH